MLLIDVAGQLNHLPGDHIIFAWRHGAHWVPRAPALVLSPPCSRLEVQVVGGVRLEYLMDVFLARQIAAHWSDKLGSQELCAEDYLDAILEFASNYQ